MSEYSYTFIVGRKGVTCTIDLRFSEGDFHHLAGLQYLSDITNIRYGSRERIFRSILSGHISLADLKKSCNFDKIAKRLQCLVRLETFLDSDQLVFRYNPKVTASKIQADFLLENRLDQEVAYLFITQTLDFFTSVSFFPKETRNYAEGQTKFKILCKTKKKL